MCLHCPLPGSECGNNSYCCLTSTLPQFSLSSETVRTATSHPFSGLNGCFCACPIHSIPQRRNISSVPDGAPTLDNLPGLVFGWLTGQMEQGRAESYSGLFQQTFDFRFLALLYVTGCYSVHDGS